MCSGQAFYSGDADDQRKALEVPLYRSRRVALAPPDPPLSDGVVVLRPMDERDVAAIERSGHDREIERWFGPLTRTPAETLDRKRRGWTDGTGAYFAICDVGEPGTCLGQVFIEPDDEGRGLVGFWVLPEARGRGRATRAVRRG